MQQYTMPTLTTGFIAPIRARVRLLLPCLCLLATVGLWLPATSQGQQTVLIDDFTTDDEVTVTYGEPIVEGAILPIGQWPLGAPVTISRKMKLSSNNNTSIPAAAAIIKNSPLVLLTAPAESPPGVVRLDLIYSGKQGSGQIGVPLKVFLTGTTGLLVRMRTSTPFAANLQLFPVHGEGARRWYHSKHVSPGMTTIKFPWTALKQVDTAPQPGPPDREEISRWIISFSVRQLEDTPLIIESVELY